MPSLGADPHLLLTSQDLEGGGPEGDLGNTGREAPLARRQLPGRPGQWVGPPIPVTLYWVEERSKSSDLSQQLFRKTSRAISSGLGLGQLEV